MLTLSVCATVTEIILFFLRHLSFSSTALWYLPVSSSFLSKWITRQIYTAQYMYCYVKFGFKSVPLVSFGSFFDQHFSRVSVTCCGALGDSQQTHWRTWSMRIQWFFSTWIGFSNCMPVMQSMLFISCQFTLQKLRSVTLLTIQVVLN